MASRKLIDFLDQQDVKYELIEHSPAITASEVAQATHIKGKELAKTVIVTVDGRLAMAVLPATDQVRTEQLCKALGAKECRVAEEDEFKGRFPDCEVGAMPPFGNLYEMEVFVSTHLTGDETIAFNAGTHEEVVQLPYGVFERLCEPIVLTF